MSVGSRVIFAVVSGWSARLFMIILNLLLMPVLFRHIGKVELDTWYILGQSAAFLGLMDFGFSPTLLRWIALAKGKSGPDVPLNDEGRQRVADLLATSERLYRVVAVLGFCVWMGVGFFFLDTATANAVAVQTQPAATGPLAPDVQKAMAAITPDAAAKHVAVTTGPATAVAVRSTEPKSVSMTQMWIAWIIICMSNAMTSWAGRYQMALDGLGYLGWEAIMTGIVAGFTLSGQIVATWCGAGIVGLALFSAMQPIIVRSGALFMLRKREPALMHTKGVFSWQLLRAMSQPAIRFWFTALGAFLTYRTGSYYLKKLRPPGEVSIYTANFQLMMNLIVVSNFVAQSSAVFVSQLWQAGQLAQIHSLVMRNVRIGLLLYGSGAIFVLTAGKAFFDLLLKPGHFMGYPALIVLCISFALEVHHFSLSISSRATDDEVFAPWSIAAGIFNTIFSFFLVAKYGIFGVVLSLGMAQLLTNYWYGSYRGLKRLKLSFRRHFFVTLPPVIGVLALLGVVAWSVTRVLSENLMHGLPRIFSIAALAGVTAIVSVYYLALDPHHRDKIWQKVLRRPVPMPVTPIVSTEESFV